MRNLSIPGFHCLLLLTLAAVGCSENIDTSPVDVTGTILVAGKPLSGGLIVFTPEEDRHTAKQIYWAEIDESGHYSLRDDQGQAVTPGWYRVSLAEPADWDYRVARSFPDALRRPDHSGILREVLAGQNNVIDLEIELPTSENE